MTRVSTGRYSGAHVRPCTRPSPRARVPARLSRTRKSSGRARRGGSRRGDAWASPEDGDDDEEDDDDEEEARFGHPKTTQTTRPRFATTSRTRRRRSFWSGTPPSRETWPTALAAAADDDDDDEDDAARKTSASLLPQGADELGDGRWTRWRSRGGSRHGERAFPRSVRVSSVVDGASAKALTKAAAR